MLRFIWAAVLVIVFLGLQLVFEKDRFFWFSLLAAEQKGTAVLVTLEKEKRRLTYYRIGLRGDSAPDFTVRDQWASPPYDLPKIYDLLTRFEPGQAVPIRWIEPWPRAPYYVAIADEHNIFTSDGSNDVLWVVLSLAVLIILVLGWRYIKWT